MRKTNVFIASLFVFLLALYPALGRLAAQSQQPEPQDSVNIKVSSNLVSVPVSVTDPRKGEPVLNLKASDFRIEEEGQRRQIVSLGEPGKTRLDLALLFDVSGSVYKRFQLEQQMASAFLREMLKPADSVTLFAIDSQPRLIQPRTRSLETAVKAIMSLQPTQDPTAFFDTVAQAADYLNATPAPETRRVLMVISDGEDNDSIRYMLGDTISVVRRSDCLFYSINPSGRSIELNSVSLRGQDNMSKLAAGGGYAFLPEGDAELQKVFRQIAAELQAQYLLGFYSGDSGSAGYRRIAVSVPQHPEFRVHARTGYYAPKS